MELIAILDSLTSIMLDVFIFYLSKFLGLPRKFNQVWIEQEMSVSLILCASISK